MLVLGQLEKAQFEQLASNPASTPTGRVYANVTNPLAAVPMFYTGGAWRPFVLGQSTATISQNSGLDCQVDWSLGLTQEVNLTNNSVITFINPQEGEVHTLFVKQVATGTQPYSYVLDMPDEDLSRGNFSDYQNTSGLAISGTRTHQWFYKLGFKTAYSTVPSAQKAATGQTPASAPSGLGMSPDSKHLLVSHSTTPYTHIYGIKDKPTSVQAAFMGVNAIAVPTAAVGAGLNGKYSPNGDLVAIANNTTPFIQVAPTGNVGRVGLATSGYMTAPGVLPTGVAKACSWHPLGTYIGVAHSTTPFMSIYPITGFAFGTKLTNPVSLPASDAIGIAFNPTGDFVALATSTDPRINVWAFDAAAGTIGAKVADPITLPGLTSSSAAGNTVLTWSPNGRYLAVCTSSNVIVYEFDRASATFGINVRTVSTTANSVKFTPDSQFLIVCSSGGIQVLTFPDLDDLSYDVALSYAGNAQEVEVHPNGEICFFSTSSTPFLYHFGLPNVQKNYVRLL